MSLRSMTGFARVRSVTEQGEITLSIRSVNHRGLDIHFHLSPELEEFEVMMRNVVKQRMARGHIQIHVVFNPTDASSSLQLNRALIRAYLGAFERASLEFDVAGKPDLNVAFRIPGMFTNKAEEPDPDLVAALRKTVHEAVDALNRFREHEGAAIVAEMRPRSSAILDLVGAMEEIRAQATTAFQKRLKERLTDLLRGASIEPQRIIQEAAVLAERSDISEELVRLKTHTSQVDDLLNAGGEVGKKLDFLLQEMNREANTILSKSGGLGDLGLKLTDFSLGAKAEIEKIREQSLNLE